MTGGVHVHKFGGASLQDADALRNMSRIVASQDRPMVVVVSAMDKMTNALESLTRAYLGLSEDVLKIFEEIKKYHWSIAADLFDPGHDVFLQMNDLFVEIEWILEETPQDGYDYVYDQIVSCGEFLSSRIVSGWLSDQGIENVWMDVRDVLRTDNSHREARVDWEWTRDKIQAMIPGILSSESVIVTQGFIGCTSENFTSTLGREGSDYTAAIFAHCLDAASLTIWKDVTGIMTADPKRFDDVTQIDRLSYREAIEMTYYGAKVLHPKTIKPLQNKSIPLYVRSFEEPSREGTWIGTDIDSILPPVVVLEDQQCLIHIATRDFAFMAEDQLREVFGAFADNRLQINLMRNTAISFTVCCKYRPRKVEAVEKRLGERFRIVIDTGLQLITVRHSNQATLDQLLADKTVVLEERFRNTVQCVVKATNIPRLKGES